MEFLSGSLLELITQTSTNLPPDVRAAMSLTAGAEKPDTQSSQALNIILSNIDMAAEDEGPICQDTGMPTFYRAHAGRREPDRDPEGDSRGRRGGDAARQAASRIRSIRSPAKTAATISGEETPVIHFEQWEEDEIEVKLILKGGGCENKNIQYSLPCDARSSGPRGPQSGRRAQVPAARRVAGAGARLRAGRAGRLHRQRSRARLRSGEGAAVPHARRRESRSGAGRSSKHEIMEEANRLGVGAMGFGGKVSLIGCKITAANRLPASFFVSVAYDCWAFRRLGVRLDAASGAITEVAVSRSVAAGGADGARRRVPADRPRSGADRAADRGDGARAEGGRRGADQRRDVHGPRRGARAI